MYLWHNEYMFCVNESGEEGVGVRMFCMHQGQNEYQTLVYACFYVTLLNKRFKKKNMVHKFNPVTRSKKFWE